MYVIRNKTPEKDLNKIIYNWLIDGEYTPDDILESEITIRELLYLPLIYYAKKYSGSCSASLGYERREDYYDWDAIAKRNVRKTRTVIDWHPYSQNVTGETFVLIYAGNDTFKVHENFLEKMKWNREDMILAETTTFESFLSDNVYLISIEEGWSRKGYSKSLLNAQIDVGFKLPSQRVNNLNLQIEFQDISSYKIIAPYWLINYEYKKKTYFILMDCSSTERTIGGRPEDKERREKVSSERTKGWIAGLLFTFLAIAIYCDAKLERFDWKSIAIGIIGVILTAIFVERGIKKIKTKAKEKREETLMKKLQQDT
jgi:hypothetical protein